MKFVIQRVKSASVSVEGEIISKIGRGYLVLIGVSEKDDEAVADKMVDKMIKLRINEDTDGKTNLSLAEVGGELLLVSQFTLYANCRKGNRPSFIEAGSPGHAEALYEYVIGRCREMMAALHEGAPAGTKESAQAGVPAVEKGAFGEHMEVALVNDGPFTIVLDSETL